MLSKILVSKKACVTNTFTTLCLFQYSFVILWGKIFSSGELMPQFSKLTRQHKLLSELRHVQCHCIHKGTSHCLIILWKPRTIFSSLEFPLTKTPAAPQHIKNKIMTRITQIMYNDQEHLKNIHTHIGISTSIHIKLY